MAQIFDLEIKKRPRQARSKATVEALVEGCALVLSENGYAGTTTNHIAAEAEVSVASLYEYFPGKDAIIALCIENLLERVLGIIIETTQNSSNENIQTMTEWLWGIYQQLLQEQALLSVVIHEVPYSENIIRQHRFDERLVEIYRNLERKNRTINVAQIEQSNSSLYVIASITRNSITKLVIDEHHVVDPKDIINELGEKLVQWVFD